MKGRLVLIVIIVAVGMKIAAQEKGKAASSSALDAVTVDPKHYKIDFENDHVRVVRVQYGPHEKSVLMHEHPGNSVGIYLTDFHAKITLPDERTRDVDAKAGKTMWRAPAVTHVSTENLSEQPLEALWVELKPAAAPTPGGGSSKCENEACSESADEIGNAEREVRQVERELTEALGQGDLATVDRIYANDYTLTSVDGEFQDKAQRIAALKSTDPKRIARNRDDITVRVYEHTAVVTGRTLFKVLSKGEESSERRRFIHAWEKRQGRWQMVASQVTRVAEAPSGRDQRKPL